MYSHLFRFNFTDLHRRFISLRTCRSSRRRRTSTLLIALLLCATSQSKMPENTKSQPGKIETATKYNTSNQMSVQCTHLSIKKCQKSVWKFWERFFRETNFSNYRLWSICCRNDLGESNATISLNFDSKFTNSIKKYFTRKSCNWCVFGEIWSAKRARKTSNWEK